MSDDSYTRANYSALSTGAENFAIAQSTLRAELDDLEGSLQAKLARWEDGAQQAYWQCKKQWDAAATDMAHVIQKLGLAIGTAHENYKAAEQAGVSIWS